MTKPPIQTKKQQTHVKTALRLPPDLHKTIQAAAEFNGRSMNAELLSRLQDNPLDGLRKENAELKEMVREILDLVRDKL